MTYQIKSPILGFEQISEVNFQEVDDFFARIRAAENENIEITLANPYVLTEYSFEIPKYISLLLDLNADSNVRVYNVVLLQNPLTESKINFLAPIIFNEDNKTAAQIALSARDYPDFRVAADIKSFVIPETAA